MFNDAFGQIIDGEEEQEQEQEAEEKPAPPAQAPVPPAQAPAPPPQAPTRPPQAPTQPRQAPVRARLRQPALHATLAQPEPGFWTTRNKILVAAGVLVVVAGVTYVVWRRRKSN